MCNSNDCISNKIQGLGPDTVILTGPNTNPKTKHPPKRIKITFNPSPGPRVSDDSRQIVVFMKPQEDSASFLAWKVFNRDQKTGVDFSDKLCLQMEGGTICGVESVQVYIGGVYYLTTKENQYFTPVNTPSKEIRIFNKLDVEKTLYLKNDGRSLFQTSSVPNRDHLFKLDFTLQWGMVKQGITVGEGEYFTILDLELLGKEKLGNHKHYSPLFLSDQGNTNHIARFDSELNDFSFDLV